jgi:hypothetical protein
MNNLRLALVLLAICKASPLHESDASLPAGRGHIFQRRNVRPRIIPGFFQRLLEKQGLLLLKLRGGQSPSKKAEDLYSLLGVSANSTPDEIKAGYRWALAGIKAHTSV